MKRNIGIVLISNCLAGAENSVYNLILNSKDNLYLFVNEEIFNHYSHLNKRIINLGKIYNRNKVIQYINYLKVRSRLKRLIKSEKIKVLVLFLVNSFIVTSYLKICLVPNLRGSDIIEYLSPPKNIKEKILKSIFNKVFNISKKIISVSRHQIQNLPEKYKKKTVVIPNGVDSKVFKPLKNIKQKKNVVLFTGRFLEIKGIREILAVAKKLLQYEFWFAGQGPLADLINLPNTKNLGFKSTKELVKLYNQSTICIAPSYREGFSNVGLEVISCSRALICTPPFSEYIENGKDGIIIPSKDEKILKDAIVKLMTNKKLRKKLEKNARKKALKYTWEEVAKKYLKVFKEVIENEKKK